MRKADVPSPLALTERVAVPGLGEVTVQSLRLSDILPVTGDAKNQELRLVALSTRDDDGEPLWSEDQWDVWAGRNLTGWRLLAGAVARVCGLDQEAAEGN